MDNLVPIGTLVQIRYSGIWEIVGYEDRYHYKTLVGNLHHVNENSIYADLSKPPIQYYKVQKRYNAYFHPINGKETKVIDKVYPIELLLTHGLKKHTKSLENLQKLIELNNSQYKF